MQHTIHFKPAQHMSELPDGSVDLVVTSPPYPMIEMWDEVMSAQNPDVRVALSNGQGRVAFELMHKELDKVWSECFRVLRQGSFLCVNIGDATRTINGNFALYNNNTRIINACESIGFTNLPNILWRKTANAPNKFMGSGMLPCGAYVTLEHEWILIFRKGDKRQFKSDEDKELRRQSAFFWEERNVWFSDIWELNGVRQSIDGSASRQRSAAFPLEVPFRLINMFSQRGDTVLDPFMGLATTAMAAIIAERQSIGYEVDTLLQPLLRDKFSSLSVTKANDIINERIARHRSFVQQRESEGKVVKYVNNNLNCKVMTAHEADIFFRLLKEVRLLSNDGCLQAQAIYHNEKNLAQ